MKLSALLKAMLVETKSIARLGSLLGVADRTVSEWLKRDDDGLGRLQKQHLELIVSIARDLGISPECYVIGPRLWDEAKTYDDNLIYQPEIPYNTEIISPRFEFLGHQLRSRFGASSSVLTSTAPRIRFLAQAGCDLITFKTVRSIHLPAQPFPNMFFCSSDTEVFEPGKPVPDVLVGEASQNFNPAFGIMNRYNIPSSPADCWQAEFCAAKDHLNTGQLLMLSVVATGKPGASFAVLRDDWKRVVDLGVKAGADIVELNMSWPNPGDPPLFCVPAEAKEVCCAIQKDHPQLKLIIKIGYLEEQPLRELVLETASLVDGFAAINSVPAVVYRNGQFEPEPAYGKDGKAGISGRPLSALGIATIRRLAHIRELEGIDRKIIIATGGVQSPEDVQRYLSNGADFVQSTSALLVDSYFGLKVQRYLNKEYQTNRQIQRLSLQAEESLAREQWTRAWQEIRNSMERDQGPQPAILRKFDEAALDVFNNWRESHKATANAGPRRRSIPSVNDFKHSIRQQFEMRKLQQNRF